MCLLLPLRRFINYSALSIVDFEQVNTCWVITRVIIQILGSFIVYYLANVCKIKNHKLFDVFDFCFKFLQTILLMHLATFNKFYKHMLCELNG